jgi:hypothetical protein
MSDGADFVLRSLSFLVMTGLVPVIHVFDGAGAKTWMPGTSPGMTSHVGKGVVMSTLCDREPLNSLLFSGAGEEL